MLCREKYIAEQLEKRLGKRQQQEEEEAASDKAPRPEADLYDIPRHLQVASYVLQNEGRIWMYWGSGINGCNWYEEVVMTHGSCQTSRWQRLSAGLGISWKTGGSEGGLCGSLGVYALP